MPSKKIILLIVGSHLFLSYIAMNVLMGLRLHDSSDPHGSLRDVVALGLEWLFFFPSIVLYDWIRIDAPIQISC
jgi:hypothetical protein